MTVQLVGVRAGEFDQHKYKSSLAVQLELKQENIEMSTVKEVIARRSGLADDVVDGNSRSSQETPRLNHHEGALISPSRRHQRWDSKRNVVRQQTTSPYSLVVGIRVVGLATRDLLRLTIAGKALIDSGSIGGYDLQADPKISGVEFGVKVVTGDGKPLCNKAIKGRYRDEHTTGICVSHPPVGSAKLETLSNASSTGDFHSQCSLLFSSLLFCPSLPSPYNPSPRLHLLRDPTIGTLTAVPCIYFG
jgi:hypothetical protein